jgi:hypothetical protein
MLPHGLGEIAPHGQPGGVVAAHGGHLLQGENPPLQDFYFRGPAKVICCTGPTLVCSCVRLQRFQWHIPGQIGVSRERSCSGFCMPASGDGNAAPGGWPQAFQIH